mgnify:CR=1 FL=1
MLDCLIIGDSIGVGIAKAMPQCEPRVKGGISSRGLNLSSGTTPLGARVVVISLGTNDAGINTYYELLRLRGRVRADKVYWIVPPIRPAAQNAVRTVAQHFGDKTITISHDKLSADGIHPTGRGYQGLVNEMENETPKGKNNGRL